MREKMPLSQRAKQFLPFDSVKGFHQALRAKEYEVEAVTKGMLSEEEARDISSVLSLLTGKEEVEAKYFDAGHYVYAYGLAKLNIEESRLLVGSTAIRLSNLFGLRILSQ